MRGGQRSRAIRALELVAAVAVVALVAVVLATGDHHTPPGHGSSSPTSSASGGSAAASSAGSSGSSGGSSTGSGSSQAARIYLPQIEHSVIAARQTAFKAVYQANGQPTTLTFAQDGSQSSFSTGQTSYYADGSTATVCDTSTPRPVCYATSPLTGLLSLVDPANEANAIAEALAAGLKVTHSNERHDGEMSSCVAYAKAGQQVKYCTNPQGVVSFIKMPAGAFVLTSYTTSVSASDVSLPPDAEIVPAPAKSG